MMKKLFENKKVTVMGIGLHGGAIEAIKWLVSQGAKVVATDKKNEKELRSSLKKLENIKNLTIVTGQHRMEDFEAVDMVVKNPAIPWNDKYIQAALKKKVPVEMDSGLFFKFCSSKKIIGVTGTKGKTTVSMLIAHILESAGKKVVRVGIGQESVLGKLKEISDENVWVVFELSSWRLSALERLKKSPQIALITNIYPDHLNYYPTMDDYVADKKNIFKYQEAEDFLFLNRDNEHWEKFQSEAIGQVGYFSFEKTDENLCVYVENDEIKYSNGGYAGVICSVKDLVLRGSHNLHNALAASLAGVAIGILPKKIKEALKTFSPIAHRLEFVAEIEKVSYYNDSAATTPEATVAAVNSFSRPIVLICGGADKKLELSGMAREISQNELVEKIVLLKGTATEALENFLKQEGGWGKVAGTFDDFESAVEMASQSAREDSLVLLSPGCASFGMFANEFDRGDQFKEIVKKMTKIN